MVFGKVTHRFNAVSLLSSLKKWNQSRQSYFLLQTLLRVALYHRSALSSFVAPYLTTNPFPYPSAALYYSLAAGCIINNIFLLFLLLLGFLHPVFSWISCFCINKLCRINDWLIALTVQLLSNVQPRNLSFSRINGMCRTLNEEWGTSPFIWLVILKLSCF